MTNEYREKIKERMASNGLEAVEKVLPTEPCTVETVKGTVHGKKAPLGKEIYHRSPVDSAKRIVESGWIKTSKDTGKVHLSVNPAHTYGGSVRFTLHSSMVDAEPVCYFEGNPDTVRELEKYEKERNPDITPNAFHAKHRINPVMYRKEAEYLSSNSIHISPKPVVKRLEYWIPWKPNSYNVSCENVNPKWVMENTYHGLMNETRDEVKITKNLASKIKVPFTVRSCFNLVKVGHFPDRWYVLNKKNLRKLEKGKELEVVKGDMEPECRC